MLRSLIHRDLIPAAAFAMLALASIGAGPFKGKSDPPPKTDESIADLARVKAEEFKVEGIGLVIGLNDTGSDPAPGWQRQRLLDEMRKAEVEQAEKWLQSNTTSLVIVRSVIPTGLDTKDRFDLEIVLPTASGTTSLEGGQLLMTRLSQVFLSEQGAPLTDNVMAYAGGPVMIGSTSDPKNPKVGRVLGGGRVKQDIPYLLVIHENRKSVRAAKIIEDAIKLRFHQTEGGDNKGMAVAKSDQLLVLKVPKVYHHNQARYFQVVTNLPVIDTPALREARMRQWSQDLLNPKTAGQSAIRLEGMGQSAIASLKAGLASTDPQVRFFAAEALAYMGDASGVDALSETAVQRKELRSYALKALAAMDQGAALMRLRALMNHPEVELRYGAFDALRSSDPSDPFLGRVSIYDEPKVEEEEDLAYQIQTESARRRRRARPTEPFSLYMVDSEGPPLIHLTNNLRSEIVIFGRKQKLLTPVVLGAGGPLLLNASENDDRLQVTRIEARSLDQPETRVVCPLDVEEVVRQAARLGATYPDLVSLLESANRQKNLPGPLFVDAVPVQDSAAYLRAQVYGESSEKKDAAVSKASLETKKKPNLFERLKRPFRK